MEEREAADRMWSVLRRALISRHAIHPRHVLCLISPSLYVVIYNIPVFTDMSIYISISISIVLYLHKFIILPPTNVAGAPTHVTSSDGKQEES